MTFNYFEFFLGVGSTWLTVALWYVVTVWRRRQHRRKEDELIGLQFEEIGRGAGPSWDVIRNEVVRIARELGAKEE